MRYIPCFLILCTIFAAACSKDKAETKPTLRVKSLSSDIVPVNGDLAITLEFADKEADLSTIFVQKVRQNRRTTATIRDTFSLNIADFPKKANGEIEVRLFYQLQLLSAAAAPSNPNSPTGYESDSLIINFALRDKADHVSDTVSTSVIEVQRIN